MQTPPSAKRVGRSLAKFVGSLGGFGVFVSFGWFWGGVVLVVFLFVGKGQGKVDGAYDLLFYIFVFFCD